MDELHWAQWLCRITGETSMRAVARKVGVSHTQVQRWTREGVPTERIADLTVRFNADPIEALVLAGRLREEHVPHLNYAAIVRYAPVEVLAKELARRATIYSTTRPDSLRKTRTDRDPEEQPAPRGSLFTECRLSARQSTSRD